MTKNDGVKNSRREFLRAAGTAAAGLAVGVLPYAVREANSQGAGLKIGVIGSGRIGSALGAIWLKAGHEVMFSSLDIEHDRKLAASIGAGARAGTPKEAAAFGEVLFFAVPYAALPGLGRDLAAEIKGGKIDFDVAIAAPDAMRVVGQLGQILGPRGLMPNPKVGTVTQDVAAAVKNAKAGQIQYRADKAGIVQCTIGRASFTVNALVENLKTLVEAVNKSKPSGVKGIFLKKVSVSSTMGAGVRVDQASLLQQ